MQNYRKLLRQEKAQTSEDIIQRNIKKTHQYIMDKEVRF